VTKPLAGENNGNSSFLDGRDRDRDGYRYIDIEI
jgi:hypothetical protein